ncbi:MAG: hypothetical protein N2511_00305 [Thermodesulfovibrionales bacterium]|nr:hypothetical protein [Thermodesulfovibrionales bacterium]
MVKAYTGWRRYGTDKELEILRRLEKLIALFMPQMKLLYGHRGVSKVVKVY